MTRRCTVPGLIAAGLAAMLVACSGPAKQPAGSAQRTSRPGKHAAPHAARVAAVSVTTAPVRTAHTKLGTVGYRIVGSGPPLVMIMGYTGTMEDWDPRFVDALAASHRVVIFDNAGIGRTRSIVPLTIDAMADQTSALIRALRLKRPAVLGWSMGGMIAEALAVRHPSQVRRLVLCATYPGAGSVLPTQAALRALGSGTLQGLMADLFPANQTAAFDAFAAAIGSYPAHPLPPATTSQAQSTAIAQWWSGTDPASSGIARIAVPTLIADGTVDRLDPVANDRAIARLIRHARLVLYPDAGHAFLFQEGSRFTALIESFLARS